jgi:hypothetical protein
MSARFQTESAENRPETVVGSVPEAFCVPHDTRFRAPEELEVEVEV